MEHRDINCTAPCSMYSVLKENKLIEDPYYGLNELEMRKLSEYDCEFCGEFSVSEAELNEDYVKLVFNGLDTICDIYLNNKKLARTINMHRKYEFDVKDIIALGINNIRLEFKSPVQYFKKMDELNPIWMNKDTIKGAGHLRKALCMSGWDWGPTLPDMGIFRPVELVAYSYDRLGDIEILQEHKDGRVWLDISAQTENLSAGTQIVAAINDDSIVLEDGKAFVEVKNPKLWWPNGYGEQSLYDITFRLYKGDALLDEVTKTIGLRTLTISTEQESDGREFCFKVNGVKIFAMGANYIPQDSLVTTVTRERIEQIINDAKFANFNCIRVWGGGYYPDDYFYDLCDRNGLIVWQDFMVACAMIWLRDEFEKEFVAEAIYNIKRIRHHASVGLLCGNNEVEEEIAIGGVTESFHVMRDYVRLYEEILPELCRKYAPQIYYRSSSPTSVGGFDNPGAKNIGDVHYWEVWHSSKPFEEYRKHKFRFCSEYGFESYPSVKTIRSFCDEADMNAFSRVMENHQKCLGGNTKILTYLANTYLFPGSFESMIYASQLNQAQAIKYGVEHFRRMRGYCMGSIYWQFNDCWPVASWSSVDYFGRYKALHYFARKFYAPVAIGIFRENGKLVVNLANETMNSFNGHIEIGICTNEFNVLYKADEDISVDRLTSKDIIECDEGIISDPYSNYFYADLYDENGVFIMRQTEIVVKPKHYNWHKPNISVAAENTDNGVKLSFKSDVFAKNVEVDFENADIVLSDNYFDIASENEVVVTAATKLTAEEIVKTMKLCSVYNIKD